MSGPVRTMLVWCPDWPVIAAGLADGVPVHAPVAVLAANRVLACSPAARSAGVRRGLRKREAQGRCPELVVIDHDPGRDARAFEPVVAAVEQIAPSVEIVRPGVCALAARGPVRYFGSEQRVAELLVDTVAEATGVEAQVGIADGVFAAGLAARAGVPVPAGGTAAFLAGLDIGTLDRPSLVDLLRRMGIRTLGEFAALPAGDVLARFGLDAALAHRLAGGRDEAPLAVRRPPPELTVSRSFEQPLERVDVAAFAARALAEALHERLAAHGLACTRLGIEAVTGNGEQRRRTWRHDGLLSAAGIVDRVRWQLEGWLTPPTGRAGEPGGPTGGPGGPTGGAGGPGGAGELPTAGIVRLSLVPDGVIPHIGLQPGLWGEAGAERDRAHRALTRVQGLLGPDAVVTAVPGGGRGPADQVRLVPWGDERVPAYPADRPWPGRLPPPAPATVLVAPVPVRMLDADGEPVTVTARLEVSAQPAALAVGTGTPVEVIAWAGPWPVDERWWVPDEACRLARFQVYLADGRALLVAIESGEWFVEAVYD